jgi:hypothetical protein
MREGTSLSLTAARASSSASAHTRGARRLAKQRRGGQGVLDGISEVLEIEVLAAAAADRLRRF